MKSMVMSGFLSKTRLLLLLLLLGILLLTTDRTTTLACVNVTSISLRPAPRLPSSNPPNTGILITLKENVAVPLISNLETPIQARVTLAVMVPIYNAAAAFDDKAREMFGRPLVNNWRRCSDGVSPTLFRQHRRLTLAYAALWSMIHFLGEANAGDLTPFYDYARTWRVDLDVCDKAGFDCTDVSKPWGLAQIVLKNAIRVFDHDGWNHDGSLSSRFNRIAYSDWRQSPYEPDRSCEDCWQPLLETNGKGFLFRQEHVTPHVGFTGKSFFVGDSKIIQRTVPDPAYDYLQEAELVLKRTRDLNQVTKMRVEFFDNKLKSLAPLFVQQCRLMGLDTDDYEFIRLDAATTAAVYESILQSWREKVKWDRIRPTTVVHRLGDRVVNSYQGNDARTSGRIKADEWEPYIRTMPHAEYPSGSACTCIAFTRYIELMLGDSVLAQTDGQPLTWTFDPDTSFLEENRPRRTVKLTFRTWSQINDVCGQSRLDGGMHFGASVPSSVEMCRPIGDDIYNYFTNLYEGNAPDFTANLIEDPGEERTA